MVRFYVHNFGCRASQADGAALSSMLEHHGHRKVNEWEDAELVVLNTCTVTGTADEDVRQTIRRVHRENPLAEMLVTGCYAQRAPEEVSALPGVRWVVGNSHKVEIPDLLGGDRLDFHGQIFTGDISAHKNFLSAPVEEASADRTRPNLKIQDGCNNRCSFCIIPSVRGPSRSATADDVVAQVRNLATRYREIVLSGINLGRWGRDPGNPQSLRLAGLVCRLLEETPVERLRLSSIEPMDLSEELLELMAASPRIAKHVHAPLQSGCDSVLKRMKRRYRARHYAARIDRAYSLMPHAAFGADVMVGFPGENEEEFDQNRQFIEAMPFTYLHVFTYSERPGTPAAARKDQVPIVIRRRRNQTLRELAAAKNEAFRRKFLGRRLSVLTLDKPGAALSDNYIPVEMVERRPANRIVEVLVGDVTEKGLREASPLRVLG